jgi:hypothetical protein
VAAPAGLVDLATGVEQRLVIARLAMQAAEAIQSAPAARPGIISRLPDSLKVAAARSTSTQPSSVVGANSSLPWAVMMVPAESQMTSAAGSTIHAMVWCILVTTW